MQQKNLPSFSSQAKSISVGSVYQHYKGLFYQIVALSRHSETLEEFVVYQALYGDQEVWVRPLSLFLEDIFVGGHRRARFQCIDQMPQSHKLTGVKLHFFKKFYNHFGIFRVNSGRNTDCCSAAFRFREYFKICMIKSKTPSSKCF